MITYRLHYFHDKYFIENQPKQAGDYILLLLFFFYVHFDIGVNIVVKLYFYSV